MIGSTFAIFMLKHARTESQSLCQIHEGVMSKLEVSASLLLQNPVSTIHVQTARINV